MPPEPVRLRRIRLPLRTARLLLRAPRPSDARVLAKAFSNREITRTLPLWPRYTLADARQFIARARKGIASGERYPLHCTLSDTGELVGGAGLEVRSLRDRRGHLGYWVEREHWGHGYASEAASRLCEEAFGTLRLHRLETGIVEGNARSRAVLTRLGFRSEGFDRDQWLIDGDYRRGERFGLLADEFHPYRRPPGS